MATLEDEIRDLKEKNNELVQKVQFWKLAAAKKEDEKLTLMKEVNELRLKLSMLRNHGSTQAKKLDSALQEASEKAIAHLVNASAEIAKSVEIAKAYMREREELEEQLPRWSTLGGTPRAENTERVHRVAPMMMEGRCVQPVVELNRTILLRGSGDTTERAVPLHMLQDVYIPLTRIDISDFAHPTVEVEANMDTANDIISEEYIEGYGPPGVPVPIHRGQRRRERRERRDRRERRERTADHAAEAYEQHAGQHYEEHVEQHQERQEQHYQENDEQHYSVQAEQHYDGQHEQHYDGQEGQHYDGEPNQHYDEQNLDSSEPMSEGNEYNIKLEPVSEEERAVMAETQRISMQLQDDSWGQQGFETIEESPEESHQASLMNSTAYDNPLEGPSWLLDRTPTATRTSTTSHTPGNRHEPTLRSGKNLTPGSTTDKNRTPNTSTRNTDGNIPVELSPAQATFSPTVRRRKRTSSPPPLATPRQPHYSPRPSSSRRNSRSSLNGRVLKVLVAKMRLDGSPLSLSPPKQARSPRSLPFDAPSPNGATDSRVIVSEARSVDQEVPESVRDASIGRHSRDHERRLLIHRESSSHQLSRVGSQESRDSGAVGRRGRPDSRASRDSDSGSSGAGGSVSEGRTRRPRKAITYKEKPLNRKLRR